MAAKPRVTIVLGTRPEAIKLAPVIQEFRACSALETRVVLTGQHREMVTQVMDLFQLSADQDLDLMAPRQTLTHVTCAALQGLRDDFQAFPPQLVLVQGDTTTAFAAALAAFYEQIPVGHVEAGLRTDNLLDPFPEEANRRLISQVAQLHFAPTQRSQANLEEGGIGGTVEINTREPLDLDHFSLYVSAEAQYQEDSDETDPLVSGLVSWKDESERFGVLASAVVQERSLQRQGDEFAGCCFRWRPVQAACDFIDCCC